MSNAARAQPEGEDVAVVGVRDTSLREARFGFVCSLCLVVLLVAVHPNWKTVGVFCACELVGAVYSLARTILEFRAQLDLAEPLPTHAVEVTHRRRPTERWTWKRIGSAALWLSVSISAIVAFVLLDEQWFARFAAAAVALASTTMLLRPVAEGFIVSRWERAHGEGRLFRPAVFTGDDDVQELFVAHRPVPAA
jgi:hypothetical protein